LISIFYQNVDGTMLQVEIRVGENQNANVAMFPNADKMSEAICGVFHLSSVNVFSRSKE